MPVGYILTSRPKVFTQAVRIYKSCQFVGVTENCQRIWAKCLGADFVPGKSLSNLAGRIRAARSVVASQKSRQNAQVAPNRESISKSEETM